MKDESAFKSRERGRLQRDFQDKLSTLEEALKQCREAMDYNDEQAGVLKKESSRKNIALETLRTENQVQSQAATLRESFPDGGKMNGNASGSSYSSDKVIEAQRRVISKVQAQLTCGICQESPSRPFT